MLEKAPPEDFGFDSGRLTRINKLMGRYIDSGQIGGMVTLVARHGRVVHFETHGYMDLATQRPMQPDTIFRIYSMTKPITAVALLICLEENKFNITDPVSEYIPAFGDMMVMVDEEGIYTDAKRPITIQDLYRHTSGLTYGGLHGSHALSQMYSEANLMDSTQTNAQLVDKLADLPLRYQPGTQWHYSMGIDVIGRLVEIFSGQTLGQFFQERIFEPLGMVDTAFRLDPAEKVRLATLYGLGENGQLQMLDEDSSYDPSITFEAGGHGLLSTTLDYYRFAQCLLNGGELDGARILGRKTVELMRTNCLTAEMMPVGFEDHDPFLGFGFGVGVKVMQNPAAGGWYGSPGDFGWGGYAETYHFIDPGEDLIGLNMVQFVPSMHYPIRKEFRAAVYQALV